MLSDENVSSMLMCGSVPYSTHEIFNVEQNGMAHEISVLAISHEVISQFDSSYFDFKVFGRNRNHTLVRLVELVHLSLVAETS